MRGRERPFGSVHRCYSASGACGGGSSVGLPARVLLPPRKLRRSNDSVVRAPSGALCGARTPDDADARVPSAPDRAQGYGPSSAAETSGEEAFGVDMRYATTVVIEAFDVEMPSMARGRARPTRTVLARPRASAA